MIPWEHLGTARIPGEEGELRLMRRGSEFSIMLGANELMNSRLSGSEEALARLALELIPDRDRPGILIGGLGMGFTLRALVEQASAKARIVVAELVPEVIDWARGEMAAIFAGGLDDPRVYIRNADIADIIAAADREFDAILLDVDNGPEGLTTEANDRLYDVPGLGQARQALKDGGVLAIWSAHPDRGFTARLAQAGFAVEEHKVRASRKGRGAKHVIWTAKKAER
ncbi:spermine/spermidine synthase domain-containing protein [Jiella marina]|uniref:spermine/spermidine synthase domain-containing protein n=1 Tax=Jiella sp. LLJ827 TaxID=2917712 RepID=UPI00210073AA|nr:hypothetical protein [Jiella sp. LLJ827]MCQ0989482.1 hypothetical protein [Jiella sp. LLJ827]